MKKVDIEAHYSLRQAVNYTPLNTRETLARYVNRYQGADWSKGKILTRKTRGLGRTAKRYSISGAWIKEFNKRYKAKQLMEYSIFSPDEVRYTLKDIIRYCDKHKIKTVKQFIKSNS